MTIMVPQQNITQTFNLTQAQLLALLGRITVAPAVSNFINVFQKASVAYRYVNTVFTNVNNVLTFEVGTDIVSNSLNATNILGLAQSTNVSFQPANPYPSLMSTSSNQAMTFGIDTANILGGDTNSSMLITVTYSVFQLA